MLKVSLLQTPCTELDGQVVTFAYKRADALLYYMLVRRSATRQELISLLWENCDEATGLKNLRNTLYTLKKTLGGEFLISPQKSIVMINDQWKVDCDYERFTREGDLSAYQGPFLQGFAVKHAFSYEEWLCRTREKLQSLYLARLEEKAREALADQNPEQAAAWAAQYLHEEPLDERMSAFFMECCRRNKQFAKAAQVYQRLKERLSEELGVDPLESTTMLYYEILNQWNNSAQPTVENTQIPVPIGRENVYAALQMGVMHFQQEAVRRCSQLLLGEMGSGKSELIDHFLRETKLSELLIIRCDCLQSENRMPMAPWDRILLAMLEFSQDVNLSIPAHVRARLGRIFTFFVQEDDAKIRRTPRKWEQSLEDSVLLLTASVARRKKILLILEDLQWMDPESLRLTDGLLRKLDSDDVMTIITCRENCDPAIRELLDQAVTDGLLRRHRLNPLNCEQTSELLCRELGVDAPRELSEQFYQETGGNLYLLTELIRAYCRSQNMQDTLDALGDILMERLNGLKESSVQVAELISLFPQQAPYPILLEFMGQNSRNLTVGLEELISCGLIEEHRTANTLSFGFMHRRIRQMVYDRLTFFKRQPLHLHIANLLAGEETPQDSTLCRQAAGHFQLAGEQLRALEYQVRALDLESERSCEPFPLTAQEETPRVASAQLEAASKQALRELTSLRRERKNAETLAKLERVITLIRGRVALFEGNNEEGTDILGSLSAMGDEERDRTMMVQACYLLASSALNVQDVDRAERYTSTGMRLLERSRDSMQQARFWRLRGSCLCLRKEYEKSSYYLQEAMDELEKQPRTNGAKLQLAATYCDYGKLCRQKKDYAGACGYFKKALSLLDDEPWPGIVWIYVHYGRTAFVLEDHNKAQEMFLKGYEASKCSDEPWGRTAAAAFTALYRSQDGDYDGAAQCLCDAKSYSQLTASPLEKAVLFFVYMRIRRQLEQQQRKDTALETLLDSSADSYARQGMRLLSGIHDVFETEVLSKNLREGITERESFRASELYSKKKHFMTE